MRRVLVGSVAASALAAASGAQGVTHQISGLLQQAQEVGPPSLAVPAAGGMAAITYDDVSNIMEWNIQWWNLSGAPTGMHFHGPAVPGVNAGIQIPIADVTSPSQGGATLTGSQETDLLNDLWYANIHTAANPGGEIRGQLGRAGSSQNTPFLPGQGDGVRGWRFTGVPGSGAWFDPISASGFAFQADDEAMFVSLQMPVIPDDNGYFIVNELDGPHAVAPGATYVFSSPVSWFTITDIFPTVEGEQASAFPIYLDFGLEEEDPPVSFTMVPIPEPATLSLCALGALAMTARRRR